MRIYEELFIVKPDAPDEEVDLFVEQLRTQLTAAGEARIGALVKKAAS